MKHLPVALAAFLIFATAVQAAPPEAASLRCTFSDGSLDFELDYAAQSPVVVVDRGGMIFEYTVTARVPLGDSLIVVGTLPAPSVMTTVFVMGAENRVLFYRDGRLVDEKQCELVEEQV